MTTKGAAVLLALLSLAAVATAQKKVLKEWSQCGGEGGSCASFGSKGTYCKDAPFVGYECPKGFKCIKQGTNKYYWQCLPSADPTVPVELGSCPQWPAGSSGQGVTSDDRPTPTVNVFSELNIEEYNAVLAFLLKRRELGLQDLTAPDLSGDETVLSYVHSINMEIPKKSSVLNYLDKGGPRPPRKARAALVLGKATPPTVREVLVTIRRVNGSIVVGDLESTTIQSTNLPSLPYTLRPQTFLDDNGVVAALDPVTPALNTFLRSAFNNFTYGDACGESCIDWTVTLAQRFPKANIPRGVYIQFIWETSATGDGNYLHPIPLQMLVVAKGADLADWSVYTIWFNGRTYNSVRQLLNAWNSNQNGIRSGFKFIFPVGNQNLYDQFEPRPGPKRGATQPVGPLPWEPYGRRFTITDGNRIKWLGWDVYVGYLPDHGPRFWDIKFKGERIAYELSLQEAAAVYGADDLNQANTVYLDSSFGMGYNLRELNQGIDCPVNAAFMNAVILYGGMARPETFKNAICVFEQNPDTPALRHYSSAFSFYGAVPGAKLVTRMISTVYNYDYIQDMVLGVDGTVDVKVVTSGYVQATTFRRGYRDSFGYPLFYNISGTVHTHVLAWKVDLDIAGTQNSVNMHHLTTTEVDDGTGTKVIVNKYDAKIAKKEEDTAHTYDIYKPKIPVVINENKLNFWGSARGYKVQLNRVIANLAPAGYSRNKGLGFWKWNFVATQQKDNETLSSSSYTQSDLASPPIDLTKYVDGESIRNEDVVVWVNSGLYHIPMAEDAPVTPSTGNELGFTLIPYNWAKENPATDMASMVQFTDETTNTSTAITNSLNKCAPSYTVVPFLEDGFITADQGVSSP